MEAWKKGLRSVAFGGGVLCMEVCICSLESLGIDAEKPQILQNYCKNKLRGMWKDGAEEPEPEGMPTADRLERMADRMNGFYAAQCRQLHRAAEIAEVHGEHERAQAILAKEKELREQLHQRLAELRDEERNARSHNLRDGADLQAVLPHFERHDEDG